MAELTHEKKLELYKQEFTSRDVRDHLRQPAIFRLLWARGINLPPPLFCDAKTLFYIYGLASGLGSSLLSLLVTYILIPALGYGRGLSFRIPYGFMDFALCFLMGGVPLGLLITMEYKRFAKKLRLPSWGEYGKAEYHISSLKDLEETDLRVLAAEALGEIGDKTATEPLMHALKESRFNLRATAAKALGRIGDTRAVSSLAHALNDVEETVRSEAAKALGRMMDKNAVGPLIKAMNDSDNVSAAAAEALGMIGDKRAVPALIRALNNRDEYVRSAAAESLGLLEDEGSTDALISALKDENEFVRGTAAKALGQIGGGKVVAPLLSAFGDGHEYPRASVAEAMGMLEDPRFVLHLVPALKDVNDYVRYSAATALGRFGDVRAVEPLIEAAGDRGGNWDAHRAAARSLSKIIESSVPYQKYYPDLFCSTCYRRASLMEIRPVRSGEAENRSLVFCPECHGTKNLLTGIKTVVGVVGGTKKSLARTGDIAEVPLWNEKRKKACFADIDFLYIRKIGVGSYHFAINAIILELSDESKPRGRRKNIPVGIEAGTDLAAGTVGMLKDNFRLPQDNQPLPIYYVEEIPYHTP